MAEWLKAHAWKACIGETLSRVRIPLSPPVSIPTLAVYTQTESMWTRRSFLEAGFGLGGAATAAPLPGASHPSLPPGECHLALAHGNQRFVSGHPRHQI